MYSLNFFKRKAVKFGLRLALLTVIHNLAAPRPDYLPMSSNDELILNVVSIIVQTAMKQPNGRAASIHQLLTAFGGQHCLTSIGVMSPLVGANVEKFARNKVQESLWYSPRLSSSLPWTLNGNSGKQVYVYCQACNSETPDLWPLSLYHRGETMSSFRKCVCCQKGQWQKEPFNLQLGLMLEICPQITLHLYWVQIQNEKRTVSSFAAWHHKNHLFKVIWCAFWEIIQRAVLNLLI